MTKLKAVFRRSEKVAPSAPARTVARVLLADSDRASRLALTSLLTTASYAVDCAGTSGEAVAQLDVNEYQLVLANLNSESYGSGARVLAYAKQKEYSPATALLASDLIDTRPDSDDIRIGDEDVAYLLEGVAELIGKRADRRMRKSIRMSLAKAS